MEAIDSLEEDVANCLAIDKRLVDDFTEFLNIFRILYMKLSIKKSYKRNLK